MLPGKRYVNDHYYTVGKPELSPTCYFAVRLNQTFFDFIYQNLVYHRNEHNGGPMLMIDHDETKLYRKALNYGDSHGFGAYMNILLSTIMPRQCKA